MSASTTSTVGSRIRCFARSRRRTGTTTRCPTAASRATMWRPTKPAPPSTTIWEAAIGYSVRSAAAVTAAPLAAPLRGATVPSRVVSGGWLELNACPYTIALARTFFT